MPKTITVIQCFQCNKFFKPKYLKDVSMTDKDGKRLGRSKICVKCLGEEEDNSLESLLKNSNLKIKS